jgi:transcriptional regulator with XRE-family HTH domain
MTSYRHFQGGCVVSLGSKIRARREEIGISLRELAARSELSPSFISLVERGLADPSITSLRKIADALETPLFHFFTDEEMGNPVVRRHRRRKLMLPGSHLVYEILNPSSARQLAFFLTRLEPGAVSSDEPLSHPMEECTFVLQGRLKLEVGSDVYTLEEGDSVCWDGNLPHRLSSVGAETLVLVSALTPPLF